MKDIFTSFAATAVIQVVTMLGGLLTARLLLPEGKGELTAIILWPSLLAYGGSLGLIEALAFHASDRKKDITHVLSSGLIVTIPLSLLLVGAGYVMLPLILASYGLDTIETARLYLIYIPLNFVALSLMCILASRLQLTAFNFLRMFVQISFAAGILFLCAFDQISVRWFAEASLAATFLTMMIALGITWKNRWLGWRPDKQIAKTLFAYGWRVHLGAIALQANLRLDQMLMSIFLPSRELGLYVVAVSLSGIVNLSASSLVVVAFPRIANLVSAREKGKALGRYVRLGLLLSLLAAAPAAFFTPWLLHVFFGSAYLPAHAMTRVLIVASIPLSLNILLQSGLKAFGRPLAASQAELLGLVVTAVSLCLLLPPYGALGAAWASLLAYSAVGVCLLYLLRKHLSIRAVELLQPTVADWDFVSSGLGVISKRTKSVLRRFFLCARK